MPKGRKPVSTSGREWELADLVRRARGTPGVREVMEATLGPKRLCHTPSHTCERARGRLSRVSVPASG
jgi:hypothetical protein